MSNLIISLLKKNIKERTSAGEKRRVPYSQSPRPSGWEIEKNMKDETKGRVTRNYVFIVIVSVDVSITTGSYNLR